MKPINLIIAGIGGQGLVMTTQFICQAAFLEGYDLKSNDVIGLAQRGGRVWGSVRFGEKVDSPNIPPGEGDYLLGIEPMEALRWRHTLKASAKLVVNNRQVAPTDVQQEKEPYPEDAVEDMVKTFNTLHLDAVAEAMRCGNGKAANTLMVGCLAKWLPISRENWIQALKDTYPEKLHEVNVKAFEKGLELAKEWT